ncbi:hypothetical protein QYE76_051646 [Lolium multiflorum]|uniref:Uncharacterized protein n=1 Tax=Lolium multiflorum TaxID=4521 RepID=A0AAD8WI36_LOLMU|nr:hypothetical protein QYE76_051646 [Lolium multiflorum]
MAEETPVTYEELTGELKKKYDEVKSALEADLIGSYGIGTNVVKLGYHPGEGSDEGGCSHSKGEEEADCFAWDYTEMPGWTGASSSIDSPKKGFRPFQQRARQMKAEILEEVKKEIEKMLAPDSSAMQSSPSSPSSWRYSPALRHRCPSVGWSFLLLLVIIVPAVRPVRPLEDILRRRNHLPPPHPPLPRHPRRPRCPPTCGSASSPELGGGKPSPFRSFSFSLSDGMGFAPERGLSSSLLFGADWMERLEAEEEEEDIATEEEGFLVSTAKTEEGDEEDWSVGMVK